MEPRVSLVTLGVSDMQRARSFYEALGFTASTASNADVTFFQAGGLALGLYGREALSADAAGTPLSAPPGPVVLAHNVSAEEQVAEVLAKAVAAGATLVKPAERVFWGGTSGYFADPDGHLWEVAHNPFFPLDDAANLQLPE